MYHEVFDDTLANLYLRFKVARMSSSKRLWLFGILFLISALLLNLVFLVQSQYAFIGDWRYFNSLSWIVRSEILGFHRFPLHNPWNCGGLDLLGNPQSRIFSPFGLLDILFAPQMANLFSIVIYCFLGLFGSFFLFRRIGVSTLSSAVGAVFFQGSSWFGLHYTEGHITYASMQMIPWVFYATLKWNERKSQFLLVGLMALFLLDGAFYTFNFSLFVILTLFGFQIASSSWEKWRNQKNNLGFLVILGTSAVLLAAVKLLPVLIACGKRNETKDRIVLAPSLLLDVFFNPIRWSTDQIVPGHIHWYHEYGCYIGLTSFLVVCYFAAQRKFFQKNKKFFYATLFWFWVGTGWGDHFNPWFLFEKLPVINNAHLNTRTLILMSLFFSVLLSKSLDEIRNKKWIFSSLSVFLIFEAFFVRNSMSQKIFHLSQPTISSSQLIHHTNIEHTVYYGDHPGHYLHHNTGASYCYEPSFTDHGTKWTENPGYQGEVYWLKGNGQVTMTSYLPGEIHLDYQTDQDAVLGVNTNSLTFNREMRSQLFPLGWKVIAGDGQVVPMKEKSLAVRIPASHGQLVLRYQPFYLRAVQVFFILGIAFYWVAFRIMRLE